MNMHYQETSREAWKSFIPFTAELDRLIMEALTTRESTCQYVEMAIEREHQAVSGNLRHLVEKGFVEASGRFGQTRSGRKAIIWRLTGFSHTGRRPEIQETLPL